MPSGGIMKLKPPPMTIHGAITAVRRVIIAVALLAVAGNSAALVICHESGVSGMEKSQSNAYVAIGKETTRSLNDAKVYVEYIDGDLYYQSNFISAGKDDDGKLLKYPPVSDYLSCIFREVNIFESTF
jgi:hypothetical protein